MHFTKLSTVERQLSAHQSSNYIKMKNSITYNWCKFQIKNAQE